MPFFLATRVLYRLLLLIHGVEMEVLCQVVHALHLLLSVHLEPLFHVDTQMRTLLSERHFRPLFRVETVWTRWMSCAFVTVLDVNLVAFGSPILEHAVLNGVTLMFNGAKVFIIHFITVFIT